MGIHTNDFADISLAIIGKLCSMTGNHTARRSMRYFGRSMSRSTRTVADGVVYCSGCNAPREVSSCHRGLPSLTIRCRRRDVSSRSFVRRTRTLPGRLHAFTADISIDDPPRCPAIHTIHSVHSFGDAGRCFGQFDRDGDQPCEPVNRTIGSRTASPSREDERRQRRYRGDGEAGNIAQRRAHCARHLSPPHLR
jgi:hypothetical protein